MIRSIWGQGEALDEHHALVERFTKAHSGGKLKRIAVLTSGGDAPGMNAAIRAVTRVALHQGIRVVGVEWGYEGLIAGWMRELDSRAVGGIIHRGGTILGTARSEQFMTERGQQEAISNLLKWGVDGLVVIGGDGSLSGAQVLHERGVAVIGIPATIDNDIAGTDMCIGADTALNTAIDAIDRIKETASSHHRAFVVEVMGRNSGYLALMAGLAAGAEVVIVPEVEIGIEALVPSVREAYAKGKPHFIAVVAEGARLKAKDLVDYMSHVAEGFEVRLTVLGHIQRGGSPTAFDRILATRLGAAAVYELLQGVSGKMVGLIGNTIVTTDLAQAVGRPRGIDMRTYELASILAR